MPITETELKKQLKEELKPVYFFFGEESYLSSHYTDYIVKKVIGKDGLETFNLHKFEGQDSTWEQIADAAEALPLMSDRSCVVVRDLDISAAAVNERVMTFLRTPPESCVLVFWLDGLEADVKKNAKWKAFVTAVDKVGVSVEFAHKTTAEIVKVLSAGAAKRGCEIKPETAKLLVEQCGSDLHLLLNEMDKLSALADGGEITRAMVETAATKNLEASVFDLSKSLLQNNYSRAYGIIHRLCAQREEPVAILAVLSTAYTDLYRAKVAAEAGQPIDSLAADLGYRGREWRLRNAARDCARLSRQTLINSLEVLAKADMKLKSSRVDKRLILEQTAAQLIALSKGATL